MYHVAVICLVLMTAGSLPAQTIALNGKVTNQTGKPISGAVVTLASQNLSATTDAGGAYSLTKVNSAVNPLTFLPGTEAPSLNNGVVRVSLIQPAAVRIELFDVRGTLLERVVNYPVSAGNYAFDVKKLSLAPNMMLIRVSIGQKASSFRYFPLQGNNRTPISTAVSSSSGQHRAQLQAIADSLQASAPRYTSKKVSITSYEATVNITLDTTTEICTASKRVNATVSGSGPHKVVVETNADAGIKEGTIYRPEDLGIGKKYPIFVWGEGACSLDGQGNSAAMAEIASYGYFVIADGTPGGTGGRPMDLAQLIKPARAYITWAIAENKKPCSAYYQSLDTSKVAGNGFSCGGLFGQAVAGDPRTATWGVSSSGSFGNNPDLWNSVHTPVLIEEGNKDATGAYTNGLRDFNGIAPLKWPVMFFSNKNFGHGGDLWDKNGGHFTRINLAWLNWWLKGDTGATGKGILVGAGCTYCTDANWEVKSANLP